MLTGEWRSEQTAQGFASATLGAHRRSQGMHFAVAANKTAATPFVARTSPRFAMCLRREGPDGSLVFEAVAMLVGALTAGVVAIQTGAPRTVHNGELDSAPGAGPMSGARIGNDGHSNVVRRGCHTVCSDAARPPLMLPTPVPRSPGPPVPRPRAFPRPAPSPAPRLPPPRALRVPAPGPPARVHAFRIVRDGTRRRHPQTSSPIVRDETNRIHRQFRHGRFERSLDGAGAAITSQTIHNGCACSALELRHGRFARGLARRTPRRRTPRRRTPRRRTPRQRTPTPASVVKQVGGD
jgi:hypothetical protein